MPFWSSLKGAGTKSWGMGKSAASAVWGSPTGRGAAIGAGVGGLYGGFSDNTSVFGGAMMGAGLGAAGGYGYGLARNPFVGKEMSRLWKGRSGVMGGLRGAGGVLANQVATDATAAAKFIGNKITTGYGQFRAMK